MNNQFWWESDFFVSFLHWMANEKDGFSDAHEIIYGVEKPWKYKNEWMEFNKEVLEEESDCPYDEPLHNHHDGCPSCYTAHPEVKA